MISCESWRRITGAMAVALCLSSWPALAGAADGNEAEARALFVEGRRLAAAGNYADACPKFEDSFRLNPGIGTNFNLADCLEHTGRFASAWTRFLDVAAATRLAAQTEREKVARERAAALEPRLSRLIVDVASPAPGLVVERDTVTVAPPAWGMAVPIDPGVHAVSASAPGRKRWSSSVTVPEGEPKTVTISVPALEVAPEPPAPPVAALIAPRSTPAPPQRRLSAPVAVIGSIGLAGLAVGASFGVEFQRANSEAKGLCRPFECMNTAEKQRHDGLVAEADRARTLGFVAAGIGGAALLTAAYLWWRSDEAGASAQRPTRAISARPRIGTRTLGGDLTIVW